VQARTREIDDREIRFLGDVQRLALGPDDILVIRTREKLGLEQAERLRETVVEGLGIQKVVVLDNCLEFGILSPEPVH
jgi:hypothetical protein